MTDDLRALLDGADTPWRSEECDHGAYQVIYDAKGHIAADDVQGDGDLIAALVNAYADGSLITREEAEREAHLLQLDNEKLAAWKLAHLDDARRRIDAEAEKRVLERALEAAVASSLNCLGGCDCDTFFEDDNKQRCAECHERARERFLSAAKEQQ